MTAKRKGKRRMGRPPALSEKGERLDSMHTVPLTKHEAVKMRKLAKAREVSERLTLRALVVEGLAIHAPGAR